MKKYQAMQVNHFATAARMFGALCLVWTGCEAQISAFRIGPELAIQFQNLHLLRLKGADLQSNITLENGKSFSVDWSDPVIPGSLIVNLEGSDPCENLIFRLGGKSQTIPVTTVKPAASVPQAFAAMEQGASWTGDLPRIGLPDESGLRTVPYGKPSREVALADITFPVVSDEDLPVLGSQNTVLLVNGRLYFSYRKAVIDEKTLRVTYWKKFLAEVTVDPAWAGGSGDEVINLPATATKIHTSEERSPNGNRILGETAAGLAQGGQSADTDDLGRIYFSNLERGSLIARFDPAAVRFEQPPIDLREAISSLLPPDPVWRRSWDTALCELVVARQRLYIVFARHLRVKTPNGNVETCSGLISLPLDHWNDARAFHADLRLHAGCWEGAPNALYRGDLAPADYVSRKLAPPLETEEGIMIPPAAGSTGGPWFFKLDGAGNVSGVAEGGTGSPVRTYSGLRKQRIINVGAAGRQILAFDCGEFRIERSAVPLLLPATTVLADARGDYLTRANDQTGTLTIRYDVSPMTLGSKKAVVQGPAYAFAAIPGEADQAIGVCEYGYYYSRLDFSRLDQERRVHRHYLPQAGGGRSPAQVGLGPYQSLWARHDDALWLYLPGYIGISRLKYASHGVVSAAFQAERFHEQLRSRSIDGASRDNVKDYRELFPALGVRLLAIGRGRPGRGGGPFSAGLELFDPRAPGNGQVSLRMIRGFDPSTPVSRVSIRAKDGVRCQEIFAAGSTIRPDYARELTARNDLPASTNPKVFAWEADDQGNLRDLFGFALPRQAQLALSHSGQYLFVLREDKVLMSWLIGRRQFSDAIKLEAQPLEFSRPGLQIWSAPDGRVFIMTAQDPTAIQFHEVEVSPEGRLSLRAHLAIRGAQAAQFNDVIRGFLPDLRKGDGTCDLILGSRPGGEDLAVRVIRDFLP